ncbi:hypothetical protein VB713_08510 [Anabaena cylindrica UHCC 0172]|nr:hypothetical protein [Anabaena cylindrica]MEA5551018.1 hypothetical protein [Anabaena cylindrica UHCC 0172]
MNKKNFNPKQQRKIEKISLPKLHEDELTQITGAGSDSEWRYVPVRRYL